MNQRFVFVGYMKLLWNNAVAASGKFIFVSLVWNLRNRYFAEHCLLADGDIDSARPSIIFRSFDDNGIDACLFVRTLFHIGIAEGVIGRFG